MWQLILHVRDKISWKIWASQCDSWSIVPKVASFLNYAQGVPESRAEAGRPKNHCLAADYTCLSQNQLKNLCGHMRQLINWTKSSFFPKSCPGGPREPGQSWLTKKHCLAADYACLSQNQLKNLCGPKMSAVWCGKNAGGKLEIMNSP